MICSNRHDADSDQMKQQEAKQTPVPGPRLLPSDDRLAAQ